MLNILSIVVNFFAITSYLTLSASGTVLGSFNGLPLSVKGYTDIFDSRYSLTDDFTVSTLTTTHDLVWGTRTGRKRGFTFDGCRRDSDCASKRSCVFRGGDPFISPCEGKKPCICLPEPTRNCFSRKDCRNGEICADTALTDESVCASERAAKRGGLVLREVDPKPTGYSFDSCRKDDDCKGHRSCLQFVEGLPKCGGRPRCACVGSDRCTSSSDCESGEVCARTPFSNVTVCSSRNAELAAGGIVEVPQSGACPVRIRTRGSKMETASRERVLSLYSRMKRFSLTTPKEEMIPSEKIVGGRVASANLMKYMVTVSNAQLTSLCSGTLISPSWILTAAHCRITKGAIVSLGASQAFTNGVQYRVIRAFSHPRFFSEPGPSRTRFDIAVAELDGAPLPDSKFMMLNDNPRLPAVGEFVRAVGYGLTFFVNEKTKRFLLRQVDIPVTSIADCDKAYRKTFSPVFKEKHICAGYQQCSTW